MPARKKIRSLTEWDKIPTGKRRAREEPSASDWDDVAIAQEKPKEPVYLKLDEDVLAWYRAKGRGYQQFMNEVLRSYMEAKGKP